jgi:two-component system LytT family response regulator
MSETPTTGTPVTGAHVGAPAAHRVRTLVVEDEAPARERLLELLSEVAWVEVVGVAADGLAAVAALDALRPALVFLDVQLPECSGLEALERAAHHPAVVFTTAYDRHAVAAFALGAVDYLLKPFGRDRLLAALDRVRRSLPAPGAPAGTAADGVGAQSAAADEPPARERARLAMDAGGWLERLFVRDRGRLVPVLMREVERLEAEDDYVALFVGGRRFLVELPLGEFEQRLDPRRFLRIHRAHIVNLDFVRQLVPYDGARLQVELRDGTKLMASRTRSRELRDLAV